MVVYNTLEQLNRIDQLVASDIKVTTQVEIEAKFLEFSEDKLKEFSANFRAFGSSNAPLAPFLNNFPNLPGGDIDPITPGVQYQTGINAGGGTPNFDNFFPGPTFPGEGKISGTTALRSFPGLNSNQLDGLLGVGANRAPNQVGFSAILAGSRVEFLISALESALGGDLMSAPKITVVNGQKSKIRVARELIYPTEYDPPELAQAGGEESVSVSIAVPSNPTGFETRDIGVTLEVKANATADRRIDLELKPEVVEFQGFINYGTDVTQSQTVPVTDLLGNPAGARTLTRTLAEGVALTPVFSNRSLTTKLQVIDGQTVVMGGFIRDDRQQFDDKVPVLGDIPLLGRLFRSKVDRSIKRNLIMFITARMIRPDGTPEFLNEQEKDLLELSLTPLGGLEERPF
ncbi:MAG: hypothetical protein HC904_07925 [Blastochloris sp.]|nr:hypothetical protein [Blastochloris sp.]